MSDSTPKTNAADRGAASPRWWIASLVFHAALVIWLVFFSPVRVIDPAAQKAQVSDRVAAKVIERIREQQEKSLGENVRTLEDIRAKMAKLEAGKQAEFVTFAQSFATNLPARANEQQQSITALQAEIAAALSKAGVNATQAVRTRANAFFDQLSEATRLAREQQTHVLQVQEQAAGLLSLGDARYAPALAALREAAAAQDRAGQALIEAETARTASRQSRARTKAEGDIEHYTFHRLRAAEEIENAETNLFKWRKELEVEQAVLKRVRTNAASAATNSAAVADVLARALDRAQKNVTAAQRRVDDAPKTLADAKKRLPELEKKVSELLAEVPAEVALTDADKTLVELQDKARRLQAEARQAQDKAGAAIAALRGLPETPPATGALLSALNDAVNTAPSPATTGTSLAQLYQSAVGNEEAIAQSYRRLRALHLAMIQRMPLTKAVQLTEVAKAVRPDLSAGLELAVNSGAELTTAREAVQSARAESGAMVRLASSMLFSGQDLDRSAGSTLSLETMWEHNQQMEQLAQEGSSRDADLSHLMDGGDEKGDGGNNGGGKPGGGSAGGNSHGGNNGGGAGGGAGGAGEGRGAGGTGGGGDGVGVGVSGAEGPFGAGPAVPGARGALGRPEDVSGKVIPFPGRRIATRGTSARWIFADSWHILGPFDNTGRKNLATKFTPEQIVDLNATYRGKNGVPIRWEFQQSATPNVRPHLDGYNAARRDPVRKPADNYMENLQYIIYYAYTELWFEEACDLKVAIGSDDFSKVWIESQLVWESGKNLKAWQINEGVRTVHFKAGLNRVLYRVENGNNLTEFSLVLAMQP